MKDRGLENRFRSFDSSTHQRPRPIREERLHAECISAADCRWTHTSIPPGYLTNDGRDQFWRVGYAQPRRKLFLDADPAATNRKRILALTLTDRTVSFLFVRSVHPPVEPSSTFIEQARRQQLIACTIASVAENGYAGASLAEIAKRAGVSKGVVLYHFRTKDELVRATVNAIFAELRDFIVPRLAAESSAQGRLRALIQSELLFLAQHRSHPLAVSYILVNHRNSRGEFYLRTTAEENAMAAIRSILEDGQKRGEFRAFAVRPMAATILNAVNGALGQWVADPNLSLKEYADELVTIFALATGNSRSGASNKT